MNLLMSIRSFSLFALLLLALPSCDWEDLDLGPIEEAIEETTQDDHPQALLLTLVNDLRAEGCQCGNKYMPPVGPVEWNDRLDDAARRHARDMARRNFFDHTGSDGSDIAQRVTEAGYNWQAVGENIAKGYRDIRSVFQGWKHSPGHCRNMMKAAYTDMGAAEKDTYWVQAFARPQSW